MKSYSGRKFGVTIYRNGKPPLILRHTQGVAVNHCNGNMNDQYLYLIRETELENIFRYVMLNDHIANILYSKQNVLNKTKILNDLAHSEDTQHAFNTTFYRFLTM